VKAVRGRADARWLPSRHHFALFRLFAYLRLRIATPILCDDLVLTIDRDQTAFENYTVGVWFVLTMTGFFATLSPLLSLPLALITVQVGIVIVGLALPRGINIRAASVIHMSLMTAAALYFATASSWVRFVAWQFLALVALNAIAAIIVFLLRDSIVKLEATFAS